MVREQYTKKKKTPERNKRMKYMKTKEDIGEWLV